MFGLAHRLHALHRLRAVARDLGGEFDAASQPRVESGVVKEDDRQRRAALPAADLVVVGLRQLREEGVQLGVLVDLGLPAARHGRG